MFEVFGLYNGLFVMDDRQTGSVWTHFEGKAIEGELAGTQLDLVPLVHITWSQWQELHPDTWVLDPDTGFQSRYRSVTPGRAGLGRLFEQTLLNRDARLPDNALVLGASANGEYRAYPFDALQGVGVLNDTLGGQPVAVFYDVSNYHAITYMRSVDGQTLDFALREDGMIIDEQTTSTWSLDGKALDGALAGTQLDFVTSFVTEWYGWVAYHPETQVYQQ